MKPAPPGVLAEEKLEEVFASHGYQEAVTPGVEFYDVFDPHRSGISQEVLYKMSDPKGRLLVLRPDYHHTPLPVGRYPAAKHGEAHAVLL